MCSRALGRAGVGSVTLGPQPAATVARFKSERALSALLLPLRSQNAGLNLSEATHVFLLDVTLERALETQALARVRRLDSTRDTFVHRCGALCFLGARKRALSIVKVKRPL